MPKQIYVKQGLFKVSESIIRTVEGELLTATTLMTGKGQMYFLDLLSNLAQYKFIIFNWGNKNEKVFRCKYNRKH